MVIFSCRFDVFEDFVLIYMMITLLLWKIQHCYNAANNGGVNKEASATLLNFIHVLSFTLLRE